MSLTHTIPIQNMTCGGCAARATRALEGVVGVEDVRMNFAAESAQVTFSDFAVLDDAVRALETAGYPAHTQEVTLQVSGMSCASCVGRVSKVLSAQNGVTSAEVNLATETATVRFLPGGTSAASLAQLATNAGYPTMVADEASALRHSDTKEGEAQTAWHLFLIAAALTIPVFVLEMGGHLFPPFHHLIGRTIGHEVSWIIQFLLTTCVLLWPGRQFFTTGVPALLHRAPTMNSLVAMGAGAAWAFSTIALWVPSLLPQGTRAVYFEAAAVIVTLILLGRWFEARAKGQTGAAIRKLIDLTPPRATVRRDDQWIDLAVAELRVGDVFRVQPGSKIPTDAKVIEGTSRVDESMITGEPMQVTKQAGDVLTGGSVNGHGSLTCRVMRTGKDTTLSEIIRMVQNAQGARLPIQALVDRVTLWFVPAVMVVAALTVLVWLIFGPSPALSHAFVAGVAVLIIACPCAMGLATPTSIMVGTGRAAELGVLFRQGDALQSLSGVQAVAFDKTGTLTIGRPELTNYICVADNDPDAVLLKLASLETHSEHPLGQAVVTAAEKIKGALPSVQNAQAHTGRGISGMIEGEHVIIGNAAMMAEHDVVMEGLDDQAREFRNKGQSVFFAAIDGTAAALLVVSDPIRPDSAAAIQALKANGLEVAMITGDALETAQAVGDTLGITHIVAEVLPGEKQSALRDLREKYGPVAFVGDGINDAPVLAEADVGIAIGTGTDVAIETADVVLMSGDVVGVTRAFDLSARTLQNIRQNLAWAFGYNVLLIPVAAGVFYPAFGLMLSPGLAAGAMAFSSVFVLANALRLRRVGV